MAIRTDWARYRVLDTPEGVPLSFEVASIGARMGAFMLDFVLIHGVVVVLTLVAWLSSGSLGGATAMSLSMLAAFLLRNFYFIFFEMRWGGKTPGKRVVKLRVVSRDGGPLSGEAVIARNLTRDVELLLPLAALLAPQVILPDAPAWGRMFGVAWMFAVALLPLFNRDRLRAGDLIGGTMVVAAPREELLDDLATAEVIRWDQPVDLGARYRFTRAQLDLYGIRELQVLEEVLRNSAGGVNHELLRRVADKIRKKIDWPADSETGDDEAFLNAFYRAQRARLEQQMLFGKRRERKVR